MNCVIIEDEIAGQEILKYKLNKFFPEIKIIKIIESKDEAIIFLNQHHNEINFIFLDIQLKGGTGIEVIEACSFLQNLNIIFTTAYEKYALDAFHFNAAHYLLKPINDVDFQEAIQRIYKRNNFTSQTSFLTIPNRNEYFKIQLKEVLYFKSDGSYTEIFTEQKKIISSKNMGDIEKILPESNFVRVHHSYIINIEKIEHVEKGRTGFVKLIEGTKVPISQRKMPDLINRIKK